MERIEGRILWRERAVSPSDSVAEETPTGKEEWKRGTEEEHQKKETEE